MNKSNFIGIDIGTQGARVVMMDEGGRTLAACEEKFALNDNSREEQSPTEWWASCCRLFRALVSQVNDKSSLNAIRAISVTSTSGTIIPLDSNGEPLHNAIMYSDPRSYAEADQCRAIALKAVARGYKAFNASSGLPKMRWFLNQFPESGKRLRRFVHAADFITGRLCGEYGVTDFTNALKSGYNLHLLEWPEYVTGQLGIQKEWLPTVIPPGVPVGAIRKELALEWSLPADIMITSGMTDGCASQVSSGAVNPGQWNTTIGTTLVIKGVTRQELDDPGGAIYNHRHPTGYWMPGGASNTGADWVSKLFSGEDLDDLGRRAAENLPGHLLAWPLMQKGERFPFVAPEASGFWPDTAGKPELFRACMEGVAFIERLAYERIVELSAETIECVFSSGGGSHSDTWLRIRSSIINRPIRIANNLSGAAGAAILAASQSHFSSLEEAAAAMVQPEQIVEPEQHLILAYEEKYRLFVEALRTRKILRKAC